MFSNFVDFLLLFSQKIGYAGIVLLMTIESSFIPFPSEVVIPPAAYLAKIGEMNIFWVIFWGTIGSLFGATINYFLAATLGRQIVYRLADTKWARLFLISVENIKKAESYFVRYGGVSTFVCRLVPAIRQLISIPAGFVRMKFTHFLLYTFLGSGLWVSFLAYVGYNLGSDFLNDGYIYVKIALFLLFIAFIAFLWWKTRKDSSEDNDV